MVRFISALGAVIALGIVVLIAFGWEAIWVYSFGAVLVVATVAGATAGGSLITSWSRRRFEDERRR